MTQQHYWLAAIILATSVTAAAAQVPAQLASDRNRAEAPADDGTSKIQPTDLICVVGGDHVLAADVFAYIDNKIEDNRDRIAPGQEEIIRRQLLRRMLVQYVMIKAQYQDFLRDVIGNAAPAEAKEKRKQVSTKAVKIFYEKQVPRLLEQNDATDLLALEEKLRGKSSSLTQLRQQFVETVLAGEAERKNVPEKVEVLREELLEYYQEHEEEWHKPARARWRQLTARFDRYNGSKAAAQAAIEAMGNEIFLGGKPFEAVAKASSQGYTSRDGGVHDWTTQGSLKSTALDAAIFSIVPRHLSQVIEDDVGYHIIEVLEREDAAVSSFEQVHDQMRDAIINRKREEMAEEYRKKVMQRTVVWTRWPQDIPGSKSLLDVLQE